MKPKGHKKTEFARKYGSVERIEWMRWQPSIISGQTPCVGAHVKSGGTGRKSDSCWIVPLTDAEHKEMDDQIGKRAFERKYGIDLAVEAQKIEARWQRERSAGPVHAF